MTRRVDSYAVAPPKRKTGGRVTPSGTRPGDARPASSSATGTAHGHADAGGHYDSRRYTAPAAKELSESPAWVPILMLAFFIVGGLAIMARYLFWDSNVPMIAGMVGLLAGLYTATKWR
ncbi:hypothetical protein BH24ACT5_BH24ACT5_01250 [soil metagenome]